MESYSHKSPNHRLNPFKENLFRSLWIVLFLLCQVNVRADIIDDITAEMVLSSAIAKYKRPITFLEVGNPKKAIALDLSSLCDSATFILLGEANESSMLKKLSGKDNVLWLNNKPSATHLAQLAEVEHVDLVLIRKELAPKWQTYLPILQQMAHTIIFEIPREEFSVAEKHLSAFPQLTKGVTICNSKFYFLQNIANFELKRSSLVHRLNSKKYHIECDYQTKQLHKAIQSKKVITTNWVQGINLVTYLAFNGCYPTREIVVQRLPKDENHQDWMPNNMIIGKDGITLIDNEKVGLTYRSRYEKVKRFILESKGKSHEQVAQLWRFVTR